MLAISVLTACAPAIDGTRPQFRFAPGWQAPLPGAPRLMDNDRWWQGFMDPAVDALIVRALRGNPDLAAARARATAALREVSAVPGALTVTGTASGTANAGSITSEDAALNADLGVELLFDPGRGREATRRAAAASAGEAAAAAAGAQLFLIGEVSEAYLSLRYDQRRLELANTDAARQRQTLELARTLAEAGEGTDIEIVRSQARLASLQAEIPTLEATVAKDIVRLAILAGDAPGSLPPDLTAALRQTRPQPQSRLAPDPGVPADLIRNRPDLRAAEARYDAARAALGQARSALYPRLSLSGTIEAERLLQGSASGAGSMVSIGPSLRLPVLPQGATRAGVDAATARIEAAHADWTSTVLRALFEVEAALLDHRAASRREAAADRAVSLHTQARSLMREAVALGGGTFGDLIAIEDGLAAAESVQANARLVRAQAFAQLNIRLGAGSEWAVVRPAD